MKNYAYIIFLTILSHLEPPQFTPKQWLPAWSPILKVLRAPFNPYKPYVCECRSVCMWVCVCECVSVSMCVCAHVSMCVYKNPKNLMKILKN
jgi:hypothetical protein